MHGILRIGLGTLDLFDQIFSPTAVRSYVAEFIATFVFVFMGVGSAISAGKITPDAGADETVLVAVALAHSFALFVAVYAAADVSGGHVNPAVTFGLVVGGHVGVATGFLYWVAQLLGAAMACLLLTLVTAGQAMPVHGLAANVGVVGGTVMEAVATFALVYTVCAARDPKKGALAVAVAVGLATGAGILGVGPLTGGSMNPARSFGPAVVTGEFTNHGVYWVGPLLGGGLAALAHENFAAAAAPAASTAASDAV